MHPRALLVAIALATTACGPDLPEGCENTVTGDLILDFPPEPGQLAAVEGVDCVRGDLEIHGTQWYPWVCDESGCEHGYATAGSSYAALAKLRRVEGDLRVEGTLLSDLDFLADLEHLGGDLAIIDNELLRGLDGSDRLTRVGGGLEVRGNRSLTYIDGFANLRELAFVAITDNEGPWGVSGLRVITGLTALETIRGDLHLQDRTTLETLEGFRSLREIGGDLEFGHCAGDFSSFESLVSVSGLRSLEAVHGDLKLICFAGPADLEGFQSLREIGGDLRIDGNRFYGTHGLGYLGMPALEHIGGGLSIGAMSGLYNFSSLEAIVELEYLELWNLASLNSFSGLHGLERVKGDVHLEYLPLAPEEVEAFLAGLEISGAVSTCGNSEDLSADCL